MGPTRVATYRREVRASLERVWENVLDWEHLPWLHRTTFAAIEVRAEGPWGWRARVTPPGAPAPSALDIEVRVDRAAGEYHTRTLAGPGEGTDIHTRLTALDPGCTRVEVAFDVPGIEPGQAAAVGEAFVALYTRLWNEDEAMMRRRQRVLDHPLAGRRRTVEVGGRRYRFRPRCPHRGGPLGGGVDDEGCVTCPWHGYRFDVRSGRSADGRGMLLPEWEAG